MILPEKHLMLSESLLGFGAHLIRLLSREKNLDELWNDYNESFKRIEYPVLHSYNNFILCLVFLYIIGVIKLNNNGKVTKCY